MTTGHPHILVDDLLKVVEEFDAKSGELTGQRKSSVSVS